jgi:hypothetical protein
VEQQLLLTGSADIKEMFKKSGKWLLDNDFSIATM